MRISLDGGSLMLFDDDFSLRYLINAENAGFDTLWLGDHLLPWHHAFKQNFYVWSVLPVVAARTKRIGIGVDVTVPIGGRYHPVIVAQACATIDKMFPGRFSLGVGSGEAMSEARFMDHWPNWQERTDRLVEAINLIRRLWSSEDYFNHEGKYFTVNNIFQYLKPKKEIPIYFSAIGKQAAFIAGKYSDDLMTVGTIEKCRDSIFPIFEDGAKSVGRDLDNLDKIVQIIGGIGNRKEITARIKRFIAGAGIRAMFEELDPKIIERAASNIPDEQILSNYYICEDAEELTEILQKYSEIGADEVMWVDWSEDPDEMLKLFRRKIIPGLRESGLKDKGSSLMNGKNRTRREHVSRHR